MQGMLCVSPILNSLKRTGEKNEKKLLKTRVLQLMELGPEYASDKLESHIETE